DRRVAQAEGIAAEGQRDGEREHQADRLADQEHRQRRDPPALEAAEEVGDPPGEARAQAEDYPEHSRSRRRSPPTLKRAEIAISPGRRASTSVQGPCAPTQASPELTVQYAVWWRRTRNEPGLAAARVKLAG